MKLLIAGDSFAADFSRKYPEKIGWPNLLAKIYNVNNIAQAGCSEYRILKQLKSVTISDYDCIIISHTSQYRIYTDYNPKRKNDILHQNSDLLYSDVKHLSKSLHEYASVLTYFEKFFSLEFAEYTYNLIRKDIAELTKGIKVINLAHIEDIDADINFFTEFKKNPGKINHYNEIGNRNVFNRIQQEISRCGQ